MSAAPHRPVSIGGPGGAGVRPSQDADRDALVDSLYAQHRTTVFRYCCRLLGNPSDADDAVQETFTGAARYLSTISGEPLAYLTAVARRICGRELARRRRLVVGVPDDQCTGAMFEDDATTRVLVHDILAELPAENRRVLGALAAGFSYADIAHALSASVTTVSTGVWRARRRARDLAGGVVAAGAGLAALAGRAIGRTRQHLADRLSSPESFAAAQVAVGIMVAVSALAIPSISVSGSNRGLVAPAASQREPAEGHGAGADAGAIIAGSVATSPVRALLPSATSTRPAPTAASTPATPAVLASIGLAPAPEDQTWFTSSTASPDFSSDGTVLASGLSITCVRPGGCPQLFRSGDGGTTWQNLGASGFPGGDILLPPDFPTNPAIFASNSAGLARSDDGGRHFVQVLQAGGPVALNPYSPRGDTQVFMATPETLVYSERTGGAVPGFVLSPALLATSVIYSGDSDHVDISGLSRQVGAGVSSVAGTQEVVRCSLAGECQTVLTNSAGEGSIAFAAPAVRTGLVIAWTQRHLWISTDDGRSFGPPLAPSAGWIGAVSVSPLNGAAVGGFAAAVNDSAPGGQPAILVSRDGGAHLSQTGVQSGVAGGGFTTLLLLSSGRLLAGGASLGMVCSRDNGAAWAPAC